MGRRGVRVFRRVVIIVSLFRVCFRLRLAVLVIRGVGKIFVKGELGSKRRFRGGCSDYSDGRGV